MQIIKSNCKIDIPLELGIELFKQNFKTNAIEIKTEIIDLRNANQRILANDILAKIDNPPFNRAPIDGYACKSIDLRNATKDNPTTLRVVGEICAGDDSVVEVNNGECVRIMTGAKIPDSCDCCIRQEDTDYGVTFVKIYKTASANQNFCFKGEDYEKGTLLLSKGTKLSYIEIGVLASTGYGSVEVVELPKIAIISTGDEVVEPTENLTSSKIYNSNSYMIYSRLIELGFKDVSTIHISDDYLQVYENIKKLADENTIIITTGGVSVGKKDIFHEVVKCEGVEQIFWKLQIQPGTPIMLSSYQNTPIISLSGNPFASLVNFEIFVRETLYYLYSDEAIKPTKATAVLKEEFNKKSNKRRFIRAKLFNGEVKFNHTQHSSGVLSSMIGCNCLIDIPAGKEKLNIDDLVDVYII